MLCHVQLKKQHYNENGLGYADFFSNRAKRKMLKLAQIKPIDVLFDLGCGDASVMIIAVKEFGVRKAIGFEDNPKRYSMARKRIHDEGLDT